MGARPDLAARNRARATHRMTKTPTWKSWESMRARCEKPACKDWPRYGGRGIRVCERWSSFEAFLADMGARPDGASIDRIDVNGHYEPSNCRWATPTAQARNRRTSVLIEFRGEHLTAVEWAERVGLERKTLEYRIRIGWDTERALTTPSTIKRKSNRGHQSLVA
jgi:hypothetical protein